MTPLIRRTILGSLASSLRQAKDKVAELRSAGEPRAVIKRAKGRIELLRQAYAAAETAQMDERPAMMYLKLLVAASERGIVSPEFLDALEDAKSWIRLSSDE